MSGQAGIDSTLDLNGVGSVQSSQQVDSSYSSVGSNIDSSLDAQYQGSFADIGVTGAQVSSSYQSTVEQAASTTATTATYESAFSVTASQGRGEVSSSVSTFIEPENAYILSIISELGINDDMAEEMRLELIMNLLANNFTYEADSAGEAWNTVEETLTSRSGDCEDLSNLAASLLLAAGFPAEDVNVYVDLQANGAQGHVVVGLMMNDQEVKLDVAQLITDKDGNYTQINESFYANNQLNRSSYDFSYSVNGVEKLNVNLSSNIVMEDINNADSFYTATSPLPSFIQQAADGSFVINGTDGDDNISLTFNSPNVMLNYNGTSYNLTHKYGLPKTAVFDIRGGQGSNTITRDYGNLNIVRNLDNAAIQAPSFTSLVDGVLTINGTTGADTINLTKNENGKIILSYNGTTYNLTNLFGEDLKINLNLNNGNTKDIVNITDVAIHNIFGGTGADEITLNGTASAHKIDGGAGTNKVTLNGYAMVNNVINAPVTSVGNNTVYGTSFITTPITNTATGPGNTITINGRDSADTINLSKNAAGQVILNFNGLSYNLTELYGENLNININSGAGDDNISLSGGVVVNQINGGAGNDTFTIAGASTVTKIVGGAGNDIVTATGSVNIAEILGGDGNDTVLMSGSSFATSIDGGAGNDNITLQDNSGARTINTGDGTNTVIVRNNASVLSAAGATTGGTITGGAGNDIITLQDAAQVRAMDTGAGTDVVSLRGSSSLLENSPSLVNDRVTQENGATIAGVHGTAGTGGTSSTARTDLINRINSLNPATATPGDIFLLKQDIQEYLDATSTLSSTSINSARADLLTRLNALNITTALPGDIFVLQQSAQQYLDATVTTTPPVTPPGGLGDHFEELDAAFKEDGARGLMQKAFSLSVDKVIAVAPAGSSKFEQMMYSMANTIEALYETLLLMSDYMANNKTFTENPGDLYALQQEVQSVKDTISTLTAVGSLSTEVLSKHMSQFISDLND